MLAGVTIVDPATTWIDFGVDARARRGRPPVHGAARRDDGRRRRRDRPARGRGRRGDRRGCDRRPVLLPSPRHGSRGGGQGGDVRGDQELTDRRAARRCRICPTSVTPTIGEDTNIAAGNVTANFPHQPGQGRRAGRRSAGTSGPAWTIRSVLRSRLATMPGLPPGRSSPTTSRRGRSPASRRGRRRRKDGSTSMERGRRWRRLSSTLPGLEAP